LVGERIDEWLSAMLYPDDDVVPELTVIAMPLSRGRELLMWYLTPAPAIDLAILRRGWDVREFVRVPTPVPSGNP
jgi:hypothetical protein